MHRNAHTNTVGRAAMSAETQPVADEYDVYRVLAILRLRWKEVAAWAMGVLIAFVVASFIMTPVYRATTILIGATPEMGSLSGSLSALSGLSSIAGVNLGGKGSQVDEALAVLQSRQFLCAFIERHKILPELYAKKWSRERSTWAVAADKVPTPGMGYKTFTDMLLVSQDRKTGLVQVAVDWRDRQLATSWVNDLVAELNEEMRARAIHRTESYLSFLREESAKAVATSTQEAVTRIIEKQMNDRMLANVTSEYVFRVVDRAAVPERKERIRPNKPLLAALGLASGMILGALWALGRNARAQGRN